MPDNNRRVLSDSVLSRLKAIYSFEYNAEDNVIITRLSTCKKTTIHDASQQFHINCRRLKKKVVFSMDAINIWKDFSKDKKLSGYSLLDVNNTVNLLKTMYQIPTYDNVSNALKDNFRGIKKLGEF